MINFLVFYSILIITDRETGLPHVKYLPVKKGESVNTNRKHFIESIDMQRWRVSFL